MIANHKNTLSLAVICDLAFLCLFKYFDLGTALPVGISFYTFSGISYCCDIANEDAKPCNNIAKLGLYLSFFPKLIMGPIVLYKDIEQQLDTITTDITKVANGLYRFSIGLAKKLIIASSLSTMVSYCWADASQAAASAWLAIIGFSLELYYDFSGYSDMAIGLAEVFGFEIEENFMYPYEAASLTDFWNRWHISLGKWFKTYVYFPLGGNRLGEKRTSFNIVLVWLATGIWHGVGLNFVAWGMFLCIFILIEKKYQDVYFKLPAIVRIIITDLIVVFGWVFFNSENLTESLNFIAYLFGKTANAASGISSIYFNSHFPILLIAAIGVTSFPKICANLIFEKNSIITTIAKCIFMLAILIASVYLLVSLGYTPFIYQSF